MPEKDYLSQRSKKTASKKNKGNPFGHLNAKYVRLQYAKAEAVSKNSQQQGPESNKKH